MEIFRPNKIHFRDEPIYRRIDLSDLYSLPLDEIEINSEIPGGLCFQCNIGDHCYLIQPGMQMMSNGNARPEFMKRIFTRRHNGRFWYWHPHEDKVERVPIGLEELLSMMLEIASVDHWYQYPEYVWNLI